MANWGIPVRLEAKSLRASLLREVKVVRQAARLRFAQQVLPPQTAAPKTTDGRKSKQEEIQKKKEEKEKSY